MNKTLFKKSSDSTETLYPNTYVVQNTKNIKTMSIYRSYLLPEEEKQSVNISSNASRNIRKLGERETKQMHLSAKLFAGVR